MNKTILIGAVVLAAVGSVSAEAVRLVTADAEGESSFTAGANWSNAALPSSENEYLVNLGAGNYLRAPTRERHEMGEVTWPGGRLTLGDETTAGELYIPFGTSNTVNAAKQWAYANIADLVAKNGKIVFGGRNYFGLYGALNVQSAGEFVLEFTNAVDKTFYLGVNITGDQNQVIRLKSSNKTLYPYMSGDNRNYYGKWVLDGARLFNVYYGGPNVSPQEDFRFGNDPGYYMEDGLYFPNGLYITTHGDGRGNDGNTSHTIPFKNRGILFANGGRVETRNCSLTINCPVKGTGTLTVKSCEGKNWQYLSPLKFMRGLDCAEVSLDSGAYSCICFGPTVRDESQCLITAPGATFVGAQGECKVKVKFTGTTGGFYAGPSSGNDSLGHLIVDEGSTLPASPNKIRIICSGVPALAPSGTMPILSVPTSLRETMTGDDFEVVTTSGNSLVAVTYPWFVETKDGYHTVYATATPKYVVPAGTPGNTPTAPYDTWATAANSIQTAIDATSSGIIAIGSGVYDINSTIVHEKSSVSLLGVKIGSITLEGDPEGVILDGGYPARTNRIMKLKSGAVRSLVFRNAATTKTGSYSESYAGGGAAINIGDSTAKVYDCVFTNCHAIGVGGAIAAFACLGEQGQVFRCRFVDNSATSDGGAANFQYNAEYGQNFGFEDCVFEGNRAGRYGGAVGCSVRGIKCIRCTFKNNHAANHGAIAQTCGVIEDCVFDGNSCDEDVGMMAGRFWHATHNGGTTFLGAAKVRRCVFRNHHAKSGVSQYVVGLGYGAVFEDCVISNNVCGRVINNCAGMDYTVNVPQWGTVRQLLVTGNEISTSHVRGYKANMRWENCTFAGNALTAAGGDPNAVAYFDHYNQAVYYTNEVVNCVFHDGSTKSLAGFGTYYGLPNQLKVQNSCLDVEIDNPADADNLAIPAGKSIFAEDGFTPRAGSILRDKAQMLSWMSAAKDILGNPRLVNLHGKSYLEDANAQPDIGAVEIQTTIPGALIIFR